MNTFWGCDTDAMTDLSAIFGERAGLLGTLIERTADTVRTTTWFGPDAEDHRLRTEDVVTTAHELIELLRRLGELLGEESAEQSAASAAQGSTPAGSTSPGSMPAGGDPLGVRATPPWVTGDRRFGGLSDRRVTDWGPLIGGPLTTEDPLAGRRPLAPLPALKDIGPMLGKPLVQGGATAISTPRPLPEGEEFDLDPVILEEARADRRLALGAIPVVGAAQSLMGVHAGIGAGFVRGERMLEENGLGALMPALDVLRLPHTISEVFLGEKSVLGQATSGIDRGIANGMQTTEEISSAIGEGDWAGAMRAGERGAYRQVDVTADLLTATPIPAASESVASVLGTGGDLLEPFSPEAAARLHGAEQSVGEFGQSWESRQDRLTDGESYYDLRRRFAPMPWDPKG